jgi:hypothetical protein
VFLPQVRGIITPPSSDDEAAAPTDALSPLPQTSNRDMGPGTSGALNGNAFGSKIGEGGIGGERVGGKRLRGQPHKPEPRASDTDNALQPANEQVLRLRQQTRQLAQEKAALQRQAETAEAQVLKMRRQEKRHAKEKAAQQQRAEAVEARVLEMQHDARKHSKAKAAVQRRAEVAEASVLVMQQEVRKHIQEKTTQQQRAEAAETRAHEMEQKANDAKAVAEAAASGIPALMRAAEGMNGVVLGLGARELLAMDRAWTAAVETIQAERARRARQIPDGFHCPITQALFPTASKHH